MRDLPDGASHVIDLRGVVSHAPIKDKWSQQLSSEFAAVLPNRLLVPAEGDVLHFQFAAKHIDAVALYVIGTAAALSNDLKLAEQLLVDAESRLRDGVTKADEDLRSALRDRVRRRISQVYKECLARQISRYTITRDVAAIQAAERIIANLRQYAQDNYDVHMVAAMAAFTLHGDMETARREIRACRNSLDAAWRYNEAFLHAYDGDLQRAYVSYRSAFDSPLADPTVPTQCEEFIQGIVEAEPHRPWLYYCLGLSRLRNSWGFRLGAVLNSPGEHPFALDRRLDAGSGGPAARREVEVGLFRRVADRAPGHGWVTDAHRAPKGRCRRCAGYVTRRTSWSAVSASTPNMQ